MTANVRVPEEVAGTVFPVYALDGSQDRETQRTDTERLDWLEHLGAVVGPFPKGHSRYGMWSVQRGIIELGSGRTLRAAIDNSTPA